MTTAMDQPPVQLNPKEIVETILAHLAIPGTVEQSLVGGVPLLSITTPDPSRLIGRHGQTLTQLQFLVNRILQHRDLNAPRVTIDCEHYRDQQNNEILREATAAAEKVRRWGEPVTLGPLGALDRQAILQQFAPDRELEAISEPGEEAGKKKVLIRVRQTPLAAK